MDLSALGAAPGFRPETNSENQLRPCLRLTYQAFEDARCQEFFTRGGVLDGLILAAGPGFRREWESALGRDRGHLTRA